MGLAKKLGEPVVELDGIGKTYRLDGGEEVPALRDISLTGDLAPIRRGEFLMIRGPSVEERQACSTLSAS